MKKVYYHEFQKENGCYDYELITDESRAKELNAPLASIEDLEWVGAASGEVVEGLIEVIEGCYKWVETNISDPIWEDIECGYCLMN